MHGQGILEQFYSICSRLSPLALETATVGFKSCKVENVVERGVTEKVEVIVTREL